MKNFTYALLACFLLSASALQIFAQTYDSRYQSDIVPSYWQQHVVYTMDIDVNVKNFQYSGEQEIIYTNNSPDTLTRVFYHLYPNAFQPNSEMNARLESIADPDSRMVDNTGTKEAPRYMSRITKLKPSEIGFINTSKLQQDGEDVSFEVEGTILEVLLNKPIVPGAKTVLTMEFEAQVPLQIRRSGRNNKEGVALSMAQWYPKLAEYDEEGWHAEPYVAREFYGVWGDFNVNIKIDKDYVLGGTGYLQNPNEIGHGYEDDGVAVDHKKKNKLIWKFHAPNVHDFSWSADPGYIHDKVQVEDGPMLHFLYKDNPEIKENWKNLQSKTVDIINYFSSHIGKYPYKQYSVLQAGDGGMEYAMCTFITGERSFGSLVGVTAHEVAHTWFQFLLATNEIKYGWMDEGFTSYFSSYAMEEIMNKPTDNPASRLMGGYMKLAKSGLEEPLTTHADHYEINGAYSVYTKGATFLSQLKYIIGEDNFNKTFKEYFLHWSFKHPDPNDFLRIAEKVSGMQLDWYFMDWVNTTRAIDFAVKDVNAKMVTIERLGRIPMPMDIDVEYTDGSKESFYVPLRDMRGQKATAATVKTDWAWAYPTYTFEASKAVKRVIIDPKSLLADLNPENNIFVVEQQ